MTLVLVLCDDAECGHVWLQKPPFPVGDRLTSHVVNFRFGPCPKCNTAMGRMPDMDIVSGHVFMHDSPENEKLRAAFSVVVEAMKQGATLDDATTKATSELDEPTATLVRRALKAITTAMTPVNPSHVLAIIQIVMLALMWADGKQEPPPMAMPVKAVDALQEISDSLQDIDDSLQQRRDDTAAHPPEIERHREMEDQ